MFVDIFNKGNRNGTIVVWWWSYWRRDASPWVSVFQGLIQSFTELIQLSLCFVSESRLLLVFAITFWTTLAFPNAPLNLFNFYTYTDAYTVNKYFFSSLRKLSILCKYESFSAAYCVVDAQLCMWLQNRKGDIEGCLRTQTPKTDGCLSVWICAHQVLNRGDIGGYLTRMLWAPNGWSGLTPCKGDM